MSEGQLLSIQVGLPAEHGTLVASDHSQRTWHSAIFKSPVQGPVWLGRTNLNGDQQADLKNHGGPDKAVLMYAAIHYDHWREDLPHLDWCYGGFGENFTISGWTEEDVCIGDVFQIGTARVQVSQPRQPCWKLARRWDQKDLTARVDSTGYTGWYVRVLEEGLVEPGMAIKLTERVDPTWTVMRATQVMRNRKDQLEAAAALAAHPLLSASWKSSLVS
jgi:MOSC domain-containing protein YiiM